MRFVLVNGRTPREQSLCTWCCEPIGESYLRELVTRLSYCDHRCYLGDPPASSLDDCRSSAAKADECVATSPTFEVLIPSAQRAAEKDGSTDRVFSERNC
jgi:hypothetical protein